MQKKLKIEKINAMQVLDSRGNPTVQVEVIAGEYCGVAMVPSGASTGSFEAIELRDEKEEYNGKGVEQAVKNIKKKIAPMLEEENIYNQKELDKIMLDIDGTPNKKNLGANAILGVSLAIAKCAANSLNLPLYRYIGGLVGNNLPIPMMNILNGGKHSTNNLSIQEFMIVPSMKKSFKRNLRAGVEIYHKLKQILKENNHLTSIGDEGGFAPNLKTEEEALEYICQAITDAGYTVGKDVFLALDVAATEMYEEAKKIGEGGKYYFWKTEVLKTKEEMLSYIVDLIKKYPIISVEDGLAEEDWETWKELTKATPKGVQLVGDDLFVTNKLRLQKGINENVANSILIKPNQIGTLTETLETIKCAKENGYKVIISHRSGETEDTFISDLAVAVNADYIKAGAPCRTDRVCKYNRLLNIQEEF